MALSGKVIVVAGTSGIVGSGIAHAFVKQGAVLVAPVRSLSSKEQLLKDIDGLDGGSLDVVAVDVGTEEGATQLAKHIKEKYGEIDHAVSSIGAWWQGGVLTDVSLEEYNKQLHNFSTSHFIFAKAMLPLLKKSAASSYTIVTGGAGERCFLPQASLVTVGAATLFGISLALRAEYQNRPERINELRIYSRIERHADALAGNVSVGAGITPISHRAVGQLAVSLATGSTKGEVLKGNAETLVLPA
eukprot:jgi/Botrbrau1/4423/Bobra.0348s0013.1